MPSSLGWLALLIGNSRLHWAQFTGDRLDRVWHTPHFTAAEVERVIARGWDLGPPGVPPSPLDLWMASVVPTQAQLWQPYAHPIALRDIPLTGLYDTLGIDRALALLGAVTRMGSPALVIDAGTALTFSGVVGRHFGGGAILPGWRLQLAALHHSTALLPLVDVPALPPRWATTTPDAIASGILYSLIASIESFSAAWQQAHPTSAIVLTGGDGERLYGALQARSPALAAQITLTAEVAFWGLWAVRQACG